MKPTDAHTWHADLERYITRCWAPHFVSEGTSTPRERKAGTGRSGAAQGHRGSPLDTSVRGYRDPDISLAPNLPIGAIQ